MESSDRILSELSATASALNAQSLHAKKLDLNNKERSDTSSSGATKTDYKTNDQKAKPVAGYYALEDITILRDARLAQHGYKLSPDDSRLILANGNELAGDYAIYLPPPIESQTITGLKEIICLALMNPKSQRTILFPYRLENSSHWVTGHMEIKKNFHISLGFHDSAAFYVKQDIERELFVFLNKLDNIKKFLLEPDRSKKILEGRDSLINILSKKNENKVRLTLLGKSNLPRIQVSDTYCGGYVLRLIFNLAIGKAADPNSLTIWACNTRNEQELRQEDAKIVTLYNKNKAHLFGSQAEARNYISSEVYKKNSKIQEEELKKIYQAIEIAVQTLEKPVIEKLLAQLSHVNTQDLKKFKEDIILACGDSGGRISLKNPVAFFFQKEGGFIDNQSRLYDKLPVFFIYQKMMELMRLAAGNSIVSLGNKPVINSVVVSRATSKEGQQLTKTNAQANTQVSAQASTTLASRDKENIPPNVVNSQQKSYSGSAGVTLSILGSTQNMVDNESLKKGLTDCHVNPNLPATKVNALEPQKEKQHKEKILGQVKKPGFVINVPYRVESDDDANGSSSDEEETHEFKDKNYYFKFKDGAPPFRIQKKDGKKPRKLRGVINSKSIIHASDLTKKQAEPTKEIADKLKNLITMFETQSFGEDDETSVHEAAQRLSVVVGLNRRESLEKRRNENYRKLLQFPLENKINVERMGFLWRPNYEERGPKGRIWRSVSFERVRSWFRALRKQDPKKAKRFRETMEKGAGEMVPYREIRETIKMDRSTAQQVKVLRQKPIIDKSKVYLGIFDGDMIACKDQPSDLGIFSCYDEIISKHEAQHKKVPTILSTGYKINEPNKPILEFAVKLDGAIRVATAEFFGNGVYYPEPNMLSLIEPNAGTVTESFTKKNEADYEWPVESKIIIENVTKNRILNQYTDFCFRNKGPITTTTPERFAMLNKISKEKKAKIEAEGNKEKLFKQFSGNVNRKGKIFLWTRQDLDYIRNTAQSHFDNLQWAKNIVAAIRIPEEIPSNGESFPKEKVAGDHLKKMIISLVSQLFNCYDPLYICKKLNDTDKKYFVESLSDVIDNYNVENFVPKAISKREKKERKNCSKTWEIVDEAVTAEALTGLLSILLNDKNLAERIEQTARKCGQVIQEQFKSRLSLNFVEYTRNKLDAYMQEVTGEEDLSEENIGKSSELNEQILNLELKGFQNLLNQAEVSAHRNKLKKNANITARWGFTPLHCAAITGNVQLVRDLIEQGARIGVRAMGGVLPLHLALKFCELQGVRLELIELLTNKNIVNHKTLDKQSPLWMAIHLPFEEDLDEDMLAVVEHLLSKGANPNEKFINDSDKDSDASDDEDATLGSLALLCDEREKGHFPIFAAIESENIGLLNLLIEYKAKLKNIYNSEGLNPILAAGENLHIVELLVEGGADVNEMDYDGSTTPLHESINPSTLIDALKAPNKYLFEYLLRLETIELTTTDREDCTPFDLALNERCVWAVKGLLQKAKGLHNAEKDKAEIYINLDELGYPDWSVTESPFSDESDSVMSSEVCGILARILVDRDTFEDCEIEKIRDLTGYELYGEGEEDEIIKEQREDVVSDTIKKLKLKKPGTVDVFQKQVNDIYNKIGGMVEYTKLTELVNVFWSTEPDSESETESSDSDDMSSSNGSESEEEYGEPGRYRKRKRQPSLPKEVVEMNKLAKSAEPPPRLRKK